MTRKIVGMLSSYKGLNQQRDWLWKQTPNPFGVWENIQIVANAPHPDFLLLYQYDFPIATTPSSPWWKVWHQRSPAPNDNFSLRSRGVGKEHIIYLLREPPLPEVTLKNQTNYQKAKEYCGYVSGPDDFAQIPDYMPAIWYLGNTFRELADMPIPEKNKPCSWITSGISRTENHRQRLAFLTQLQASAVTCDVYGRGLPNSAKGLGSLNNKWHGMAPYYYNLAIENFVDNDWYVTEKLWDSLLAWCLPIYYGGSAADKLLPPGSFLRLPSLDEKGIAYIKEVIGSEEAWHEAKAAIAEARQVILHKLNLLAWLSDYVEKIA